MQHVDRGRPAGPPVRGARSARPTLAVEQGGLDRGGAGAKSSGLTEALSGSGFCGLGWGWEEGVREGTRGRPAAPVTPHPVPAPRADHLAATARRLQGEAEQVLRGAAAPIAVRVAAAAVRWQGGPTRPGSAAASGVRAAGARIVGAATLLVGADPAVPSWSRTARLAGDLDRGLGRGASWPAGWLDAAARETAVIPGETGRAGSECDGPAFETPHGTLLVDAFAAGDLLRLAALGGSPAGRSGGTLVAGLARGARALVRRAPSRPPTGSWRSASDPPWEELALEVARRTPWPEDGFVLTRLVPLRSVLVGAGHLRRGGTPVARWGPVVIPSPAWWLARIEAALGDPVDDATGPPVACPPLQIDWGRELGPR